MPLIASVARGYEEHLGAEKHWKALWDGGFTATDAVIEDRLRAAAAGPGCRTASTAQGGPPM